MGREGRARIGLWFLLGSTLLSFSQVYASTDYGGPALLGMLLATLIAMLTRRLGLGAILSTIASVAGLSWYLSIVFAPEGTWYLLPTGDTLTSIRSSVEAALQHSNVDYAPVPMRPGYAIAMVTGMWLVTHLGESGTFRWRLPALAVGGPIALFAAAMILGTGRSSPLLVVIFLGALLCYLALESAYSLRTWGRWVSGWAEDGGCEEPAVAGPLARRMGALSVAAALVAPFFLPAVGSGLLSWRNETPGTGAGTSGPDGGGGGGGRINPWVTLEPQGILQSDEDLLHVRSPEPAYWRLTSLDRFEEGIWTASGTERVAVLGSAVQTGEVPLEGRTLTQEVTITGLEGESLPAAVQATDIAFLPTFRPTSSDESGSLSISGRLDPGTTYVVESRIPSAGYRSLSEAVPASEGGLYLQAYPLSPEVENLVARWTRGAETPLEELIAVQDNLNDLTYSLDVPPPSTGDYLTEFLIEDRAGYCQQFATAFALIARSLGYPTRISVGFLPGTPSEADPEELIVRGTDAHAWPEVLFEGHGWVRFEPTPRGDSRAPGYAQAPASSSGNRSGPGSPQPAGSPPPRNLPRGISENDARSRNQPPPAAAQAPRWRESFARVTQVLAIAFFALLLLVPLLKEGRARARYRRARDPRSLTIASFSHFQSEAADLAARRRASEPATRYAERLSGAGRVDPASALRLASLYEAAQYSARPPGGIEAKEARGLAGRLRSQLWDNAGWWTRLQRLFSPRGLRPGT